MPGLPEQGSWGVASPGSWGVQEHDETKAEMSTGSSRAPRTAPHRPHFRMGCGGRE